LNLIHFRELILLIISKMNSRKCLVSLKQITTKSSMIQGNLKGLLLETVNATIGHNFRIN